ncbi:MAG TPA: hypothetical protein VIM84_15920, partial [Gemmatimonadales bacterium]
MKLLLLFLLAAPLFAQGGNAVIIPFAGAPSGSCGPTMLALNRSSGALYSCNSGSWSAVGGGGTPGGSNTQVQYNDSGAFGGSANFTFENSK